MSNFNEFLNQGVSDKVYFFNFENVFEILGGVHGFPRHAMFGCIKYKALFVSSGLKNSQLLIDVPNTCRKFGCGKKGTFDAYVCTQLIHHEV